MAMMPAGLFDEWMIYDRIEPFGDFNIIRTIGRLVQLTANINLSTGAPSYELNDCIPFVDTEELWEEIDAALAEQQRLSTMTQAEIDAEALRQFEEAHRSRMGLDRPTGDEPEADNQDNVDTDNSEDG